VILHHIKFIGHNLYFKHPVVILHEV